MAGRSKSRAAKAAAAVAEPDWAAEAMRLMTQGAPDPAPAPTASTTALPAINRADLAIDMQRMDRRSLATWWREQADQLEAEYQDRLSMLSEAGEHPSAL